MAAVETYNTAEDIREKLGGVPKMKSYLAFLKKIKSAIVIGKDEQGLTAIKRRTELIEKHPEYFTKNEQGMKQDGAIEQILEFEKKPSIGDIGTDKIIYKDFLDQFRDDNKEINKPFSSTTYTRNGYLNPDDFKELQSLVTIDLMPEKKAEGVQEKPKEQEVQEKPKEQEELEEPKTEKGKIIKKVKKEKKIKEQQAPTPEPTQKPMREQEAEQMETLDISDIGKIEKKKPVKKKKGGNMPEEKIPEEKMPEEKKSTKWFKSLKKKDLQDLLQKYRQGEVAPEATKPELMQEVARYTKKQNPTLMELTSKMLKAQKKKEMQEALKEYKEGKEISKDILKETVEKLYERTAGGKGTEGLEKMLSSFSKKKKPKVQKEEPSSEEEFYEADPVETMPKQLQRNPANNPALSQMASDALDSQPKERQIAPVNQKPEIYEGQEGRVIFQEQEEQKQEYDVKSAPVRRAPSFLEGSEQEPKSTVLPKSLSQLIGKIKTKVGENIQEVVSTSTDVTQSQRDSKIGNVRDIGIAPYDALAKAENVIPSMSEREKSLQRFANLKWIPKGGNNNSRLADLSPFQKIEDHEYDMRYGRTFKMKCKIPVQDYYKPYMYEQCKKYFTNGFEPAFRNEGIMQPTTVIGFAESDTKKDMIRNVLINEKEFDNTKNTEFLPKYEDRPKAGSPFTACNGLESYYPNKPIMPPIRDPLQKPSISIHPDTGKMFYE
jgi:hypothetical protein